MQERHRKQELFEGLGAAGQKALGESSALVAGCGALGGTIAIFLVRAGVGRVVVVDRDFPEVGNLGRQLLYNEEDVASGLPKAVLAQRALARMNSSVAVTGVTAHIGPDNARELTAGVDIVMDGLDNQETRYLLNDAAVETGKPFVYAGCVGSAGNVMAVFPGRTPCLRCVFPEPAPPGTLATCDTAGIIGPAAGFTASLAAARGMRILAGGESAGPSRLASFDVWSGAYRDIPVGDAPRPDCPCCGRKDFEFLEGRRGSRTESLCGVDAVQVNAPSGSKIDLAALAGRLDPAAIVTSNQYLLRFRAEGLTLAVFPDGRTIIHGTNDHAAARAVADRWLGL